MITNEQKQALCDFLTIIQQKNLAFLLIGAGARLLIFDLRCGVTGRGTTDWDVAVKFDHWNNYNEFIKGLCAGEAPLFRADGSKHRIIHISTKMAIDIVPFGAIEKPETVITWPATENKMNVLGYEEALADAEDCDINGSTFKVLTVYSFVALKLFAWEDRKADKDLQDIYHILRYYQDMDGKIEEIYKDLGEELESNTVEYGYLGAYHVGMKIAQIFPQCTRVRLTEVIQQILESEERYIPILIKFDFRIDSYDELYDAAVERLRSLQRGVQKFGTT
jgi:predicted nucleotidyltransferase